MISPDGPSEDKIMVKLATDTSMPDFCVAPMQTALLECVGAWTSVVWFLPPHALNFLSGCTVHEYRVERRDKENSILTSGRPATQFWWLGVGFTEWQLSHDYGSHH